MSRHQRHCNELRELCAAGGVARAIDLAFEHFAHFGRDEEIIELLARSIDETGIDGNVRRRFVELCTSQD